jgi:hypothetical protein
MATYPEVKTEVVNGVTEMDGNQINNIEDYVGIVGDTHPETITYKLTNPASESPGHVHDLSNLRGGADGTILFKDPADHLWKAWLPDTIGIVLKTGEQTIGGKKIFTTIPEGPEVVPTTDNQLIRKKYADDQLALRLLKIGPVIAVDESEGALKLTFFGGVAQAKQVLTDEALTAITHSAPATPDFAIQDLTNTGGFGFATKDEGNTVLQVIANLQARITTLEAIILNYGLVDAVPEV